MKYDHFIIQDDEIAENIGEIESVPSGFIPYQSTFSGANVYYKIVNKRIT